MKNIPRRALENRGFIPLLTYVPNFDCPQKFCKDAAIPSLANYWAEGDVLSVVNDQEGNAWLRIGNISIEEKSDLDLSFTNRLDIQI